MENEDVLVRREGRLGCFTLNRPKALNALTLAMCQTLLPQLRAWATDSDIDAVLIDAVPGRAFCAGGDIRAIYELGRAHDALVKQFFLAEYPVNSLIKHFPKPYVGLIDGIAMGGGVGVSVHGSHRVVSENALFAMPETAIGLFPDVGGSFFLPRLPGQLGMYLALTGVRINPADMMYAGIATHYVRASHFPELRHHLVAGESLDKLLESLADDPGPAPLANLRETIDHVFAQNSVEAIMSALAREGSWGAETAALLSTRSPTSLKLTYRQMQEGKNLNFDDCMRMEYRMMRRVLGGHDLYEGVRAAIIDKGDTPHWQPSNLESVSDADIARYFLPLGTEELLL